MSHRPTREQLRETADRLRQQGEYYLIGKPDEVSTRAGRVCLREVARLERLLARRRGHARA